MVLLEPITRILYEWFLWVIGAHFIKNEDDWDSLFGRHRMYIDTEPLSLSIDTEPLSMSSLSSATTPQAGLLEQSQQRLGEPVSTSLDEEESAIQNVRVSNPSNISSVSEASPSTTRPSSQLSPQVPCHTSHKPPPRGTKAYKRGCLKIRRKMKKCENLRDFSHALIHWEWHQWFNNAIDTRGALHRDAHADLLMLECIPSDHVLNRKPSAPQRYTHDFEGRTIFDLHTKFVKRVHASQELLNPFYDPEDDQYHEVLHLRCLDGPVHSETNCSICRMDCHHSHTGVELPHVEPLANELPSICYPETVKYLPLMEDDKRDFKVDLEIIWGMIRGCDKVLTAWDASSSSQLRRSQQRTTVMPDRMRPPPGYPWRYKRIDFIRNLDDCFESLHAYCKGIRLAVLQYLKMSTEEHLEAVKTGKCKRPSLRLELKKALDEKNLQSFKEIAAYADETTDEMVQEQEEQAVETACGHLYGLQCLKNWLKISRTCPMCRRTLVGPGRNEGDEFWIRIDCDRTHN